MSDQLSPFDEVFRSKLSEHSVSPPDSVWEAIEAKRSFGHVIANKISINWRTFGTVLLLLLGGGSSAILFGGEDYSDFNETNFNSSSQVNVDEKSNKQTINTFINQTKETAKTDKKTIQIDHFYSDEIKISTKESHIPDIELLVSIEQAAFTRPIINGDPHLNILIQEQDGWESAKPISFVHIYELDQIPKLSIIRTDLDLQPQKSELDYDYVEYEITRKPFKERASILFAFTPQSITKSMTADYNLSSSYLKHRTQSEQTRLAYTFEANLHYELKNHKFFETGINFTQIYEEMSFKGEKRFSNQYDFIEIPLLLGYEDRNSKWGYHIKGGLGVQVYNNFKGYIYKKYEESAPLVDPIGNPQYRMRNSEAVKTIFTGSHRLSRNTDPNEVLDLSNDDENPYKSSGVINFHMAAGLTYYHSINTSFVITPYYRRSVNSITKESALFTERITYMGVSLGTRIKF